MTDNEKLARWQGKEWHDFYYIDGGWFCETCKTGGSEDDPYQAYHDTNPDYLNDDAAAMSLLDTLVEKGYRVCLETFNGGWRLLYTKLSNSPSSVWDYEKGFSISAAITSAVLALIERTDHMENVTNPSAVSNSELIRRCTLLVGEADALLQLLLAGQEQLATLETRVKRIEMKLASCR